MDHDRFDALAHSVSAAVSRRSLGRLLTTGGLVALCDRFTVDTSKAHRHKRRKKNRPRFNQFGCVDVGGSCFGNDAHCCSGICEGTGKTSRCVGHNELTCDADDETCAESVPCGGTGVCYRTTGKAGFCGDFRVCNCLPCQQDADCEANFGPGAACVVCVGDCAGVNRSQGTACVPAAA